MTELRAATIMRAPGRLVFNPTSLEIPYPYGGTPVGATKACVLTPVHDAFQVKDEGQGTTSNILEPDDEHLFSFTARGKDKDLIRLAFPGRYSEGTVTKQAVYEVPGSIVPGASALGRAVVALYVPDDVLHVDALVVYRGIPMFVGGGETPFQRQDEIVLQVVLHCIRSSGGKILQMGRLADLSLSA